MHDGAKVRGELDASKEPPEETHMMTRRLALKDTSIVKVGDYRSHPHLLELASLVRIGGYRGDAELFFGVLHEGVNDRTTNIPSSPDNEYRASVLVEFGSHFMLCSSGWHSPE